MISESDGQNEGREAVEIDPGLPPDPGAIEVERGNEIDISPPRGHPFPVVGIGGSAGALDAFSCLLDALPNDTGMAFVIVQHLDPHHESQLPEILATHTTMPVHVVEDGIGVRPNEVFVIPPNATILLEDGVLRLTDRNPGLHLPIDTFFESLAHVQGGRAIGVVLSGNASDGSLGLRAIKAECGLTFAQEEATAQHVGMPRNAIATGAVDYVLSPSDIAKELVHLSRHPFVRPPEPKEPDKEILPEGDHELKKLFALLRARTNVDFTHYKSNTIRRRISRRMIVKRTKTLGEYNGVLSENTEEARELYRDLLISVTSFFRDAPVFDALNRLLKDLLVSRDANEAFRVWVPGCATGEEAYSIAICLRELIDELDLNTTLQVFATDISDLALGRARAAVYPELISQDVPPERLRRFFIRMDKGYQVSKSIRESCIFARQDVTTDPPFGHTDLISCRNLLIYLDSALQRRVLPMFHYSLNPTGLLVLGTAESIAAASDLFSVVEKEQHIYGRKAAPVRLTFPFTSGAAHESADPAEVRTTLNGVELQRKTDLVIQSKYSPAAVVVDGDLQILQFRGRTGFYLDPAPGEATLNILRLARKGLTPPLRKAVEAAAKQNISVRETGIPLEHRGERRQIDIEVTPIAGASAGERYFLVVFEEAAKNGAPPAPVFLSAPSGESTGKVTALESQVRDLQKQLAEAVEHLRNTDEDHEAHLEELRAANEEIRSANEELQSTNEELGTTKEELQSANEELTTLNEELQNRNQELNLVNSDLGNLLSAVDVAFLILDRDLRLRKFSAAAVRYLNVQAIDIGYPLTHLQGRIDLSEFQAPTRKVVDTLAVEKRDIQDREGHWLSATIRPYRTVDDRIAGAVIVFVDIDPLKRTLRAAEEARDYAEDMISTVREPLLVLDGDLRIQRATSSFYQVFRVSREETEGRLLYDLGNGQWNSARLRELLGDALFRNHSFQDFEIEHDFPHLGRRRMRLNGRRISSQNEENRTVLLAIEDVTERREEAEIRYQRLFETAKDAMLLFDMETGALTDVNPYFLELTGFGREQLIGRSLGEMEPFQSAGEAADIIAEARLQDVTRHDNVPLATADGRRLEAELLANRYSVGTQHVVQVNLRDVTDRARADQQLRTSLREKEVLLKEIHHRVKNNLQVIASLLSLQSEYLPDAKSRAVLEEMNTRVRSIAAIHEMLYAAPDLSSIDFGKYLDTLAKDLFSFYSTRVDGVRIQVNSSPLLLEITQAVPCGLIVNELLTNAFKHAFPATRSGLIEVSFHCSDERCSLGISDNGIGLPVGLEPETAASMGLQLLDLLVRQLEGELRIDRQPGTRFTISFPRKIV